MFVTFHWLILSYIYATIHTPQVIGIPYKYRSWLYSKVGLCNIVFLFNHSDHHRHHRIYTMHKYLYAFTCMMQIQFCNVTGKRRIAKKSRHINVPRNTSRFSIFELKTLNFGFANRDFLSNFKWATSGFIGCLKSDLTKVEVYRNSGLAVSI